MVEAGKVFEWHMAHLSPIPSFTEHFQEFLNAELEANSEYFRMWPQNKETKITIINRRENREVQVFVFHAGDPRYAGTFSLWALPRVTPEESYVNPPSKKVNWFN